MSSTTATSIPHSASPVRSGYAARSLAAAVVTVLFFALYLKYFERLLRIVTQTHGGGWSRIVGRLFTFQLSPDWAHVLVIPFFSLYYLYLRRRELELSPHRVYLPGLTVMFAGILGFIFWVYPGRNDMFQGFSMVLTLLGMVLLIWGPRTFTLLWFPVLYLVFSIKVADQLWDRFAWKLQAVAAQGGALLLRIGGLVLDMDAEVRGSTIDVWNHGIPLDRALDVAQACSGLRSLMAFVALGTAIAFIYRRPWWHRVVLVASTIPIAVLINMARVATVGVLAAKINPSLAGGDFHTTVGMLMLIPAAGLFLLLGWIMEHLLVAPKTTPPPLTPTLDPRPLPQWSWRRGAAGAALGVLLAMSVGLLYTMFWGIFQPQQIGLTPVAAIALLVAGGLGAVFGLVLLKKVTRSERLEGHLPAAGAGVVAGVLLAAALGLGTMVHSTQLVLIKESLPLRAELRKLPAQTGSWQMVRDTPALDADVLDTLGTDQFVIRWYRDDRAPQAKGDEFAILHVAYYTGTPDTVPHVPDRCFVANGLRPVKTRGVELQLRGEQYQPAGDEGWAARSLLASQLALRPPRLPTLSIPATSFTYQSPERGDQVANVIYFFVANGRFMASPNEVRELGFQPWDHYSYYAKVEIELPFVADPVLAVQRASDFLSLMLPEVMSCLPDWELIKRQGPTAGAKPASDSQAGAFSHGVARQ